MLVHGAEAFSVSAADGGWGTGHVGMFAHIESICTHPPPPPHGPWLCAPPNLLLPCTFCYRCYTEMFKFGFVYCAALSNVCSLRTFWSKSFGAFGAPKGTLELMLLLHMPPYIRLFFITIFCVTLPRFTVVKTAVVHKNPQVLGPEVFPARPFSLTINPQS